MDEDTPMTPEEHEAAIARPTGVAEHVLTRQSELGLALPILKEVSALFTKALKLQGELAVMLAADNGIPFDQDLDRPQFTVDESGNVALRIFYPCQD